MKIFAFDHFLLTLVFVLSAIAKNGQMKARVSLSKVICKSASYIFRSDMFSTLTILLSSLCAVGIVCLFCVVVHYEV